MSSPTKKCPSNPHPKHQQDCKTERLKQTQRVKDKKDHNHFSNAVKHAIRWYTREKEKSDGLLANTVAKKLKEEFEGVGSSAHTIQCYVKDKCVGMSPSARGKQGNLLVTVFKLLYNTFENFVQINQLNGHGTKNSQKITAARVNGAIGFSKHKVSFLLLE